MRVVRLVGGNDLLAWMNLRRDPKRFHVGHGAAAAKMSQVLFPAKHGGELCDGFSFHHRACSSTIHRMIIWIDELRHCIG